LPPLQCFVLAACCAVTDWSVCALQSLRAALQVHPRVGSRLELYYDKPTFHLQAGAVDVHVIKVGSHVMKQSPDTWLQVCEKSMPPQNPGYGSDASPLFQAVMLVSNDLSEGCILIAGFEHVLGDATSYSMFLRTWSEKYEACLHAHRDQLSPAVLPAVEFQMPFTRREIRSLRRFFAFSAEGIGSLKDSSMDGCTTNDILMAQCACALAPIRLANMRLAAEAAGAARILVMADRRGRGISSDSWGNFAVDLSVEISWHLLASGNVATVARGETNFYPRPSCCAVRVCSSVLGLIF
jgi:hypothetical protein